MPDPDHLLSVEEVATILTLAPSTVKTLAQKGEWPHIRLPSRGGTRYVFSQAQLQQILDMLTVTPQGVKRTRPAPAAPKPLKTKAS